ncbi:ABC transporter ATP-binding protein [Flaviflexus equikiangi]|uniref:ABC transporter ATP-binding protein n=1 Tax=Flaviflexus equikiangi TaxID=2758573 RepID=UPI0015F3F715|nr:ABC transporter ATP-binding protein [Flaviflexus equikiangi]
MAERALVVTELTKSYGEKLALDGLSVSLEDGAACALVGPNGAGKTTLISILLGLIAGDSGRATIFGDEAGSIAARKHIGYLPDVPSFPGWMRADEVLHLSRRLSGGDDVVDPLLEAVGLAGNRRPVRMFSRGMKQRLGLAQALVSSPRLLILDEPTSALDPAGQRLFHDLVRSLRGRATVLYSTHSLGEAEQVCDSAIIVNAGRLVRQSSMDNLIREGQGLFLDVSGPVDRLVDLLGRVPWVSALDRSGATRQTLSLRVADLETAQRELPGLIASSGVVLHSLNPRGLADIFLDLTGGSR